MLAGIVIAALVGILLLNLFAAESEAKIRRKVEHEYGIDDPQFLRAMGALLGPPLTQGNQVETLINGDRIFPAMLEAIQSAQKTITFETYIYWSGDIGKRFAEALAERAKAGVRVHILLDWVGSQKIDDAIVDRMQRAGVEIRKYHPPHWYTLDRLNNRTHRKLLVVDGMLGFTGGVGIADEWNGDAQDEKHWRDTHYRLRGPAVAHMQAAFVDNWMKVSGTVLHGESYFPQIAEKGKHLAQMFKSSREGGAESMHLMYLLAIASARKSIDLSMAYFVPDDVALEALEAALQRGVRIRIIMPGHHTDSTLVRRASRALWGRILEKGAEMHEYQPTMFHCKVLVVDGLWVSVGSTNFDTRSFRLNDEANLNVFDAAFASEQTGIFEADLKRARRITHEEWLARPWRERFVERVTRLFRSQL